MSLRRPAWGWLLAVTVWPIVVLPFIEHASLSDAWKGIFEFAIGFLTVAAVVVWVHLNGSVLAAREACPAVARRTRR